MSDFTGNKVFFTKMYKLLKIVAFFVIFTITSFAFKYDIVMRDEQIFSPCDNPAYHFWDEYLDFSGIQFETLANGSVYVKGDVIVKRDIKGNNPATLRSFKKKRDSWISTIYNLNRPDACKHVFNRYEIWASALDFIPKEQRICPFYKGQKIHFDVVTDLSVHIPDPQAAGEYKLQLQMDLKDLNETYCANVFADIYRA